MKRKVLIFCDYYLPGFKAGGPIRSLSNLVDNLNDGFDFFIYTSDRDFLSESPYTDLRLNHWEKGEFDTRFYVPKSANQFFSILKNIKPYKFDTIYFNSFFSFRFSILPILMLWLRLIKVDRIVIAPRGEFNHGALNIKKYRKFLFIIFSKFLRLHKKVIWHSTNNHETSMIYNIYGISSSVICAPNLPKPFIHDIEHNCFPLKSKGDLKLVFVGRLSEIKNIDFALMCLNGLNGNVVFDIYGPQEDFNYFHNCLSIAECLPDNISVSFKGAIDNSRLHDIYPKYHFFFSPTKGENFGHSIFEAFSHCLPVIISDQTPWNGLEELSIGWDVKLDSITNFHLILKKCIDMEQREYESMVVKVIEFVKEYHASSNAVISTKNLFDSTLILKD